MNRYVASDGTVYDSRPWSVSRVVDTFWGVIAFFTMFGQTLVEPLLSSFRGMTSDNKSGGGRTTSRGWGGGFGGGGGGFGGGSGPGSGPGSGRRPGGSGGSNIHTLRNVERVNFSPCAGGSCGR